MALDALGHSVMIVTAAAPLWLKKLVVFGRKSVSGTKGT